MKLTIDYAGVTVRADKQIRAIMANADLANDERIAADMRSWANGVFLLWSELVAMVGDDQDCLCVQLDSERLRRLMQIKPPVALPVAARAYDWNGVHA